jgi:hypothetical protein
MLTKILVLALVVSVFAAPDWSKLSDLFTEMVNERAFPGGSVIVAN